MEQILKEFFEKYNISYDDTKIAKLIKFYDMVIETNKVMNLTNITDEKEFAIKNVLDCVLPMKIIPINASVLDIGAGAGFPSIPLKIMRPDLDIVMVDSLNKRINFLKTVIQKLDLKNISANHMRIEDYAITHKEKYDFVVARAVARLNTLLEYSLPLVRIKGKVIAYKSQKADEEIAEAQNALNILGGKVTELQTVLIKEIDSIRVNIVVEKLKSTPKEYPRGKNLPKLKPII